MKALLSVLLALTVFTGTASAQEKECISQAEMQEISSHFSQFKDLANKDFCYDGSRTSHLLAGIMFMRKTQFSLPMQRSKDQLFSGRFAPNWYNYFIGRINDFEIDEGCPKGVGAYVYAFGGRTMYVCTMMLTDNFTALDRASIFMHEARHIDGFPHTTCRSGPRAGLQGACDTRITDGGSYAVTVETYSQLSRYAVGIHPALKAYARSASVIYADEAFDSPVTVNRGLQFLALGKDKNFYAVKTNGTTEQLGEAPAVGKIVMRAQHMILFPSDKNLTARYVFARGEGEIAQTAGDLAVEYNGQSPAERAKLMGIHIGGQWNARVYRDKIRFSCDPRAEGNKDIELKGVVPVAIIYPNGYDRAAKSAHLMSDSGKVYEFGCPNTSSPSFTPSSITLDQKYTSVHKAGNLILGLTAEGSLREIQGASSRPFPLGALDGQIAELVPNQTIEFYGEQVAGR